MGGGETPFSCRISTTTLQLEPPLPPLPPNLGLGVLLLVRSCSAAARTEALLLPESPPLPLLSTLLKSVGSGSISGFRTCSGLGCR